MNRRSFLASLGLVAGSAFAHELDLERLLWVPGAKTIFLPSPAVPQLASDTVRLYASGFLKKGDVVEWGLESVARLVSAGQFSSHCYRPAAYLGVVLADPVGVEVLVQTTGRVSQARRTLRGETWG